MPRKKIDPSNPDTFVVCPLCSEKMASIGFAHLRALHDISMKEFNDMYPGFIKTCKQTHQKKSANSKERYKQMTSVIPDMKAHMDLVRKKLPSSGRGPKKKQVREYKIAETKKNSEEILQKRQDTAEQLRLDSRHIDLTDPNDYVMCPACDEKYGNLINHLKFVHNLSVEEFHTKYPGNFLQSKNLRKMHKECGHRAHDKGNLRNKGICLNAGIPLNFDNKVTHSKFIRGIKEAFNKPEYKELQRQKQLEYHASDRSIEHVRNVVAASNKYISIHYTRKNGEELKVKGSWEACFTVFLDSVDCDWEYESLCFRYENDGVSKKYYPDFYLPLFQLIVEITGKASPLKEVKREIVYPDEYTFIELFKDNILPLRRLFPKDFSKRCSYVDFANILDSYVFEEVSDSLKSKLKIE